MPIIGWEHEIKSLSTEDALDFYDRHYVPNNAILIVSGDITAEELKPLAEKYYGVLPAGDPGESELGYDGGTVLVRLPKARLDHDIVSARAQHAAAPAKRSDRDRAQHVQGHIRRDHPVRRNLVQGHSARLDVHQSCRDAGIERAAIGQDLGDQLNGHRSIAVHPVQDDAQVAE